MSHIDEDVSSGTSRAVGSILAVPTGVIRKRCLMRAHPMSMGSTWSPTASIRLVPRNLEWASFNVLTGTVLPFASNTFDGAFVNEVLEHVENEQNALTEIRRVLRTRGHVVVMSPNRWFPIDGHAVHIAGHTLSPVPLVPWLPERWTRNITDTRNYWPRQLVEEVRKAGFEIIEVGYIWPVLEQYRWLPEYQ